LLSFYSLCTIIKQYTLSIGINRLSQEVSDYFYIVNIKQSTTEFRIHLDENGNTRSELPVRGRYLLFKLSESELPKL